VASIELVAAKAAKTVTAAIQHATTGAEITMRELFKSQMAKVKQLNDELVQERQDHQEKVRAFEEAKEMGLSREWMAQIPNGNRVCTVCTTHQGHFRNPKQVGSLWLPGNGGVRVIKGFSGAIRDHEESEMHKLALGLEAVCAQDPLGALVQTQNELELQVTMRLMRTAVQGVKQHRAFLDYEHVVYLQHLNGVELGDRHHGRKAASTMLEFIYADEAVRTRHFMSSKNSMTGTIPFVGMAADKVCDKVFDQWEVVNGRVNYLGAPVTFLADLRKMHEDATGLSCWKEIKAAEEHCGIVPEQSQSFCFDGEAAYQGHLSGVSSHIAKERPMATVGHDYPHAGELLKGDMHNKNPYIEIVQDTIRQIYSFFAKSPKRLRGLEEVAKECEVDLAKLHYVFEVRMVESEVIAIKNFLSDVPEIITYLEQQQHQHQQHQMLK
jgi:hypothetical protein